MPPGSTARYVIDTCSLTALQDSYPRENFEAVWLLVEALVESGALVSVEDVYVELAVGGDGLLRWAKDRSAMFAELDDTMQLDARQILRHHPTLVNVTKPGSSADAFLIAHAQRLQATVVTEELPSGGPQRQKIPDVCAILGIECIRLLEVLRREGLGRGGGRGAT